jgi:putative hemolysin
MEKEKTNTGDIKITEKFIQLDKVIASKNPMLLKILPGFVIRYLKKVTHEDNINDLIYRNREKYGLDFIQEALDEFGTNIIVLNEDKIPKKGRYVIAANHPLGGLDGIALMGVVGNVRKDIVFPVNDLLLNVPNLRELFIPINKHGSNVQYVRIINDTFESDKIILYFPAGLVSRKQSGVIKDLPWKKTFITKARKYKRDVIPVYIEGRNSNFFYNLANFRKFMGIKSNIEMLYLVKEMYDQCDKTIHIVFGDPISYQTFDRSQTDAFWTEMVRQTVYELNPFKE